MRAKLRVDGGDSDVMRSGSVKGVGDKARLTCVQRSVSSSISQAHLELVAASNTKSYPRRELNIPQYLIGVPPGLLIIEDGVLSWGVSNASLL